MDLHAAPPTDYLDANAVIDSDHALIKAHATSLRKDHPGDHDYARAAFEWVRDHVDHSYDVCDPRVTVTASDVLVERVGLCYAKAHLLTALLRAQGIPAGLCYQRLSSAGVESGYVIHGVVAVYLNSSWHRLDPRGNKPGVDAQFSLSDEQLAWSVDPARGEIDYPIVYESPVSSVLTALWSTDDVLSVAWAGLPSCLSPEETFLTPGSKRP